MNGGKGIHEGLRPGFATRDLCRLQAGWTASSVGGWAFMVALSVYAYDEGGAAAVGVAALVRMLPAGAAAPLVGLLADRHSRRDVLVVSCGGRAAALAAIAGAVAAGAPLALVLALAAIVTVLQTAHRPAQAGLLALLARTPRELAAANAVSSGLDNAGFVAGALLGGALIATAGTAAVFSVTAALLVAAAAALALIARDGVPEHRAGLGGGWGEIAGGLRAVRADPALRLVVGVVAATTFVEGLVDVLVVVAALTVLELGDAGPGWLNAAWGAGGLAGGAAALGLLHRGRLSAGLAGGAVLAGLSLLAVAALPAPATGLLALVAFGIGYALVEIAELTLIQRLASDELLARTFGVTECLYWIATGLGAIVAPALIAWLGVRGALAVAGGLLVFVAARARALAPIEDSRPVPERAYALLRGVGFLAPVPLATLENLALRLQPVGVAAGDDVVREGEPGERFYLVDAGTLDVHAGGRALARLGPGDCFGEIALLRGVPRTATVTARGPARLLALRREEFVAAVTGVPRAAQAAERFADARLREEATVHAGA